MKLRVLMVTTKDYCEIAVESERYLRQILRPTTELDFAFAEKGFPSIESELHAGMNIPEVIRLAYQAQTDGCDGIFVNCFDDPGVYACREALSIPVFGGYQPAMLTALGLGERIAVVTTDRDGILSEERKARLAGFDCRLASVRMVDLGVLSFASDYETLTQRLEDACITLWEQDRVSAAVLGCTAMYAVIQPLRARLRTRGCPIQVVEPLAAGVATLEQTVHLGFTNTLGCSICTEGLIGYPPLGESEWKKGTL